MIDERMNSTTIGIIVYNQERKRWELNDYPLDCGDQIDLLVFRHWIPGTLQLGASGWFLLTLANNVAIRIKTGMTARCDKQQCPVTPRYEGVQDAAGQ